MCRPKKKEPPVPAVAKAYLAVYQALPTIKIPFTDLDVSFTLLSTAFLITVRFASEYLLHNAFGWPYGPQSEEAAAGMTSICHSTILLTGLYTSFVTQRYDVVAILKEQTDRPWWPKLADALLQFCTGYMLYDTLIGILYLRWDSASSSFAFTPDDYLYLMHHWMTSFYMTSARVIGAGYMSAFICMFLGELSNPLQNSWLVAQKAMELDCCNGPAMQAFEHGVKLAFCAVYFAIRAGIAPVYFANATYHITFTKKGRANIPIALGLFWNVLIWGVEYGSLGWIEMCYHTLVDLITGGGGGGQSASQQQEL